MKKANINKKVNSIKNIKVSKASTKSFVYADILNIKKDSLNDKEKESVSKSKASNDTDKEVISLEEFLNVHALDVSYASIQDAPDKSVIAVSYSGGRDSLAHVIRMLKSTNYTILPVVNRVDNILSIKQSNAMAEICIRILAHFYPNRIIKIYNNMSMSINVPYGNHGIVLQPLNCLGLITCNADIMKKIKEYHVCYIMNDTALSYMDELKNLFNAYSAACGNPYTPEIIFPDIKYMKFDNVQEIQLFEKANNIVLPTLTCEEPNIICLSDKSNLYLHIKPCGICDSCKKLANAKETDNTLYTIPTSIHTDKNLKNVDSLINEIDIKDIDVEYK